MIVKNGKVFGEDKKFVLRDLYIEDGIIVGDANEIKDKIVIDAAGCYVIPGLIDIHSHGALGYDFSDADEEGLRKILIYQRTKGITSYCPTSMTLSPEKLEKVLHTARRIKASQNVGEEAVLVGINMEGPFLDSEKKGAHLEEYIMEPSIDYFRKCNQESGGLIRLVTLAPNKEGAIEFITNLKGESRIALGHTAATYRTSREAINAGACHITHLHNAMLPLQHREPGLIGAAAENGSCMAELICDGVHVHESMVRASFKLFPDRIILISDSIRATGMEDGMYELGGQQVTVSGKLATLEDGTIAGSVTNLFDCMRTAIAYGIDPETAIAAATMNPAKSIGIYDRVGSLSVGKKADILLLDKDFRLKKVI